MFDLLPPLAVCKALALRLRALRLARNLSQLEMAQRAGVSLSTVRRFESSGNGSLALAVQFAQVLGQGESLDGLFLLPVQSIAQAQAQATVRRRARRPAGAAG